jgi:hypothetical protein
LTGKPQSRITREHPVVLGQHLGIEDLDAHLVGGLGELAQQHRAQPLALHRVGDLQSHLGPLRPVGQAREQLVHGWGVAGCHPAQVNGRAIL